MYNHIAGTLESKTASEVVVDAGGVGFVLRIPISTAAWLPDVGTRVKLLTHFHVTEDAHTLFGFATEKEREFFLQLRTVSGVGPKTALAVLSAGRVEDIQHAIRLGDFATLKRVKGVGEGTAKKIVLELGKILIHKPAADVGAVQVSGANLRKSAGAIPGLDADADLAVKAVVQLQEVAADVALQAVQRAFSELSAKSKTRPAVQDIIQLAMRYT